MIDESMDEVEKQAIARDILQKERLKDYYRLVLDL